MEQICDLLDNVRGKVMDMQLTLGEKDFKIAELQEFNESLDDSLASARELNGRLLKTINELRAKIEKYESGKLVDHMA